MTSTSYRADEVTGCALCSSIARPKAPWDRPLAESEHLIAIPSLGSLVEGWLLIVPRAHFISTGSFTHELAREFAAFKRHLWCRLEAVYGPLCAFEHGPCAPSRPVGCGVDHAHVHLVPVLFDLVEAARPFVPDAVSWTRASWAACRDAYNARRDYLFIEQPHGTGSIATAPNFESQVLRKALATGVAKSNEFDWRGHPHYEIVDTTIQSLSAVGLSG